VSELQTRTKEWIEGDPDPRTRADLTALLSSGDPDELAERMDGTLEFGTAGIRGVVEAGSNRMNRAVVIRTTAGLVAYLDRTTTADQRYVVVGRDARPSSAVFMEDTIGVLLAAGYRVGCDGAALIRLWPQEAARRGLRALPAFTAANKGRAASPLAAEGYYVGAGLVIIAIVLITCCTARGVCISWSGTCRVAMCTALGPRDLPGRKWLAPSR